MATSTNKTAAFGVKLIHKCMSKHRYIQKNSLLVESLFKNYEGHNVTVNGDRYRAMITNFFIPELNNHDVQELWFQQDGATCLSARATIDLLKDTFGDRLISRFGPVNWPPRSCDLTPLDYFLWGYVKSLVYAVRQSSGYDHKFVVGAVYWRCWRVWVRANEELPCKRAYTCKPIKAHSPHLSWLVWKSEYWVTSQM
ncbi:uncharacterized protein TNCV_4247221 [Trichonephila clavipes]|nr:uncharacterized protein TNCV_4247221 [Trichonephila clavipes]